MGNKLKAIKRTSLFVIVACLIPYVLSVVFDSETLTEILMFGLFGIFIWIIYSINLTFIELEDRFKDKE